MARRRARRVQRVKRGTCDGEFESSVTNEASSSWGSESRAATIELRINKLGHKIPASDQWSILRYAFLSESPQYQCCGLHGDVSTHQQN
ncbi:hypothetical protein PC115_g16147 [Phytophthora cactorum]|uniref:Uncharacterized protein n=1 Tax=Phytophthora cactorum TaxID=29920 RepID=A0A8T1BEY9_9STRA|nr:hypothetical protein PC115_g16147 [Phytophthora cactorum]